MIRQLLKLLWQRGACKPALTSAPKSPHGYLLDFDRSMKMSDDAHEKARADLRAE
jgi:hypothetical protein